MAATLLLHGSDLEVVIGKDEMLLHLSDGLIRDGIDTKFLLSLGEVEPELTPSAVARALTEKFLYLIAGVARVKL